MKKLSLLACAFALLFGAQSLVAQNNQEVTYVEDPNQGYLLNRFKDNWFITAEGGANLQFSKFDSHSKFGDRLAPNAGIYVGKWFSPIIGVRLGVNWYQIKGLANSSSLNFVLPNEAPVDGFYKQKMQGFAPQGDVLVNLTNWWCGYHPGRVYNAIFYAGGGVFISQCRNDQNKWVDAQDDLVNLRAGLINQFNITKHFAISLDLRATAMEGMPDINEANLHRNYIDVSANLGLTYNFGKSEWSVPVVPVYPEPENCDALRARLSAADARIADLEAQLRACLNRPVEVAAPVEQGPLATIYYPIGVSRLTRENINVLKAIALVMKNTPDKKFVLTGWADNYTGTDAINIRLRKNRVAGVEKQLLKAGVPASQISATTNNGNLCDLGEKFVALDRAVTIEEAK